MPAQASGEKKNVSIDAWKDEASGGPDLHEQVTEACRILIVDSNPQNRLQLSGMLADLSHELLEAKSTEDAFVALSQHAIDLVIVDLNAPEIGAIAFCELIRKAEATHLIPVFVQAAASEQDMEMRVISAGADEFLVPPLKPAALRARVHATLRHKAIMASLDDSESVLFSLGKSVEDRDPDLGQHCQRLALMAAGMGLALGLSPTDVRSLHRGGYLHDIGKIGIPDRVLFKAGPLTPDEWEIMKSHAQRGERICACAKSLASVLPIIRHHHEKFDGSGYPDGLKGDQIPLLARILQVVDIYDALTTERPYKRAYTSEEAIKIMREETDKGWRDPYLIEVFADLLPVFRHPAMEDMARLSLEALAESLEQFRRQSRREPIPRRN